MITNLLYEVKSNTDNSCTTYLSKDQIIDLYPLINATDIVGGVHIPKDGQADPVGVTNVLANKSYRSATYQSYQST